MVASQVADAVFEQFAAQSNVRGISDAPDPYKMLGVARDLGRSDSRHLGDAKTGFAFLSNATGFRLR
jgi:hypothetical protein